MFLTTMTCKRNDTEIHSGSMFLIVIWHQSLISVYIPWGLKRERNDTKVHPGSCFNQSHVPLAATTKVHSGSMYILYSINCCTHTFYKTEELSDTINIHLIFLFPKPYLHIKVYNMFFMHMFDTLAYLANVLNNFRFCQDVILINQSVK